MTTFDRVIALFHEREIAHALIGAAALAARGVARSTFAIDVFTVDGRILAPSFWDGLRSMTRRLRFGPETRTILLEV